MDVWGQVIAYQVLQFSKQLIVMIQNHALYFTDVVH